MQMVSPYVLEIEVSTTIPEQSDARRDILIVYVVQVDTLSSELACANWFEKHHEEIFENTVTEISYHLSLPDEKKALAITKIKKICDMLAEYIETNIKAKTRYFIAEPVSKPHTGENEKEREERISFGNCFHDDLIAFSLVIHNKERGHGAINYVFPTGDGPEQDKIENALKKDRSIYELADAIYDKNKRFGLDIEAEHKFRSELIRITGATPLLIKSSAFLGAYFSPKEARKNQKNF